MVETLIENGTLLVVIAVLTEAVTEIVKNLFPKGSIQDKVTYALSIIVGIVLAFAFNLNLFGLGGNAEYVSIVFAGIIASRGANYVNGFLKKFNILR